ncbi:MAG: hypothetical protein ABIT05_07420 [Chitinophagaceae bacterium]
MKKKTPLFLVVLAVIALSCGNKKEKDNPPQNNDYLVSMNGIDSLNLGMTKAELEKLLNTKLNFPHIVADNGGDTINVKYRNIDMTLFMDGSADSSATLRGIQTSDPSCKTAGGVGVGADKMKVIDSYADYLKYVAPEYEEYPVRSSTRSAVAVMDTLNTGAMVFHIINKKVVSVEVQSYYEFY